MESGHEMGISPEEMGADQSNEAQVENTTIENKETERTPGYFCSAEARAQILNAFGSEEQSQSHNEYPYHWEGKSCKNVQVIAGNEGDQKLQVEDMPEGAWGGDCQVLSCIQRSQTSDGEFSETVTRYEHLRREPAGEKSLPQPLYIEYRLVKDGQEVAYALASESGGEIKVIKQKGELNSRRFDKATDWSDWKKWLAKIPSPYEVHSSEQ